MPELPEVETVRRGLQPVLEGATISGVTLGRAGLRYPFPEHFAERLAGRRVLGLGRRSKYLLWEIEGGETLLAHLGMSGSFRIEHPSAEGVVESSPGAFALARSRDARHDHVRFDLRGGAAVVYNDPRRFGFMDLLPTIDVERHLAIARNHTATHILHSALIHVLGGHVRQNGSLVSDRFLRFDYTHFEALNREQIEEVEMLANAAILANKTVTTVESDLETAKASGAKALFEEKYGDRVRVVSVGDVSSELCGGTHVAASGMIGSLKIISEESIGSGIRRITAVTGMNAFQMFQTLSESAIDLSARLCVKPARFIEKIESMEKEIKDLKRQVTEMSRANLSGKIDDVVTKRSLADGAVNLYVGRVDGQSIDLLRESGDKIKDLDPKAVFIVLSKSGDDKVQILSMVGEEALRKKLHAGKIVKEIAAIVGGGGGGRPNMAQAGGKDPSKIGAAIEAAEAIVSKFIGA